MSPGLGVERLEAEAERADLDALVASLARFSPLVRALPPEDLIVEAPPEQLAPLRRCLGSFGHFARLVWAPLARAATLLARHRDPGHGDRAGRGEQGRGEQDRVVLAAEVATALAPLPIAGLGLPPPVLDALTDVGIVTLGQFAGLPAAALVGRYGAEVGAAHALCQGREPPTVWPLPPPRPESSFAVDFGSCAELHFDGSLEVGSVPTLYTTR